MIEGRIMFIAFKFALSAAIIVAVSEIAKRSTSAAGFFAALPLTSVLILIWLHVDGQPPAVLGRFISAVCLGLIPGFAFLIPALILFRQGTGFYTTMAISTTCLAVAGYIYQRWMPF